MFRRTVQSTFRPFNIQNYTRRFYNQTIQTIHSAPRTYTHTLAVATVSAISISAYSYQNNEPNAKAAAHTDLSVIQSSKTATISNSDSFANKFATANWTEREIIEQPIAISKALKHGTVFHFQNGEQNIHLQPLLNNKKTLSQISDLIITNNGSQNKNAALYAQKLMEYIESFNTVKIADYISNKSNTHNILCVNNDNISLNNKIKLDIIGGNSQSFTSNVTVLSLIAAWFSQLNNGTCDNNKKLITALHKLVTYFGGVIKINKEKCIKIGENINDNILIFGKGFGECIAYEGCDKIKQIISMNINVNKNIKNNMKNVSVICIVLDDEYNTEMVNKAKECAATGADMIYITDNIELLNGLDNINNDKVIKIPNNGPLTALLAVVPLQLIGYYIAMAKGLVTIDENDIDE